MMKFARVEYVDSITITHKIVGCLNKESGLALYDKQYNARERIVLLWGNIIERVLLISHCTPQNELERAGVVTALPKLSTTLGYGFDINDNKLRFLKPPSPDTWFTAAIFAHRHPSGQPDPSDSDLNVTQQYGIGLIWCDWGFKDILDTKLSTALINKLFIFKAYGNSKNDPAKIDIPIRIRKNIVAIQ